MAFIALFHFSIVFAIFAALWLKEPAWTWMPKKRKLEKQVVRHHATDEVYARATFNAIEKDGSATGQPAPHELERAARWLRGRVGPDNWERLCSTSGGSSTSEQQQVQQEPDEKPNDNNNDATDPTTTRATGEPTS